jgi:hypothetical protein
MGLLVFTKSWVTAQQIGYRTTYLLSFDHFSSGGFENCFTNISSSYHIILQCQKTEPQRDTSHTLRSKSASEFILFFHLFVHVILLYHIKNMRLSFLGGHRCTHCFILSDTCPLFFLSFLAGINVPIVFTCRTLVHFLFLYFFIASYSF